ncbi:MAG TPA: class II aldolase/adducin family protein [Pseudolabrys sp.]
MTKLASVSKISRDGISPAEWQARVDLAAVYRLTAYYGWDDVIYNHSSMRVPDEPRQLLMKRHDLLYTEVTASNLVKVSMDEDLDEKSSLPAREPSVPGSRPRCCHNCGSGCSEMRQ